jgi:hypothetical protein
MSQQQLINKNFVQQVGITYYIYIVVRNMYSTILKSEQYICCRQTATGVEVKNERNYNSATPYAFMTSKDTDSTPATHMTDLYHRLTVTTVLYCALYSRRHLTESVSVAVRIL